MTDKLRLAKYMAFDAADKINYYDMDGLSSFLY
jgi:hypothetical protein